MLVDARVALPSLVGTESGSASYSLSPLQRCRPKLISIRYVAVTRPIGCPQGRFEPSRFEPVGVEVVLVASDKRQRSRCASPARHSALGGSRDLLPFNCRVTRSPASHGTMTCAWKLLGCAAWNVGAAKSPGWTALRGCAAGEERRLQNEADALIAIRPSPSR